MFLVGNLDSSVQEIFWGGSLLTLMHKLEDVHLSLVDDEVSWALQKKGHFTSQSLHMQ